MEAAGMAGVCEGVAMEVVGKGSSSLPIPNLEYKTEPLKIRNVGRKKDAELYLNTFLGKLAFSSFEDEEEVEGRVYFSCSDNATEVLENDDRMTCGLDIEEAAFEDVEFRGAKEGVSLWVCLFWYWGEEGNGDEDGDSKDVRTDCNGLFCFLTFSSVETLG